MFIILKNEGDVRDAGNRKISRFIPQCLNVRVTVVDAVFIRVLDDVTREGCFTARTLNKFDMAIYDVYIALLKPMPAVKGWIQ
jgi:hypothetical protein